MIRWIFQFLFGYDLFISYAWKDATEYAASLEAQLRLRLYCFRDSSVIVPGDSLAPSLSRALGKSNVLLLIASREACRSEWVAKELEEFHNKRPGHTIIPIDLTGERSTAGWPFLSDEVRAKIDSSVWLAEKPGPDLLVGASKDIVNGVLSKFGLLRKTKVAMGVLGLLVVIFAAIAGVATLQYSQARVEKGRADKNARRAEEEAKNAVKSAATAVANANLAERRRVDADNQRQIAEIGRANGMARFAGILSSHHDDSLIGYTVLAAVDSLKTHLTDDVISSVRGKVSMLPKVVMLWPEEDASRLPMTFSFDGSRVFSSEVVRSERESITVWGLPPSGFAGKVVRNLARMPVRHGSPVTDMRCFQNGRCVAAILDDEGLTIYDLLRRKPIRTFRFSSDFARPKYAMFTADGKAILTTQEDEDCLRNLSGDAAPICSSRPDATLDVAGQYSTAILSGGLKAELKDRKSGKTLGYLWISQPCLQPDSTGGQVSADGRWIAASGANGTQLEIFDAASGTGPIIYDVPKQPQYSGFARLPESEDTAVQVSSLAFSPDSRLLASAFSNDVVRIWRLPEDGSGRLEEIGRTVAQEDNSHALFFSPDGRMLMDAGESPIVWQVPAYGREDLSLERYAPYGQLYIPSRNRLAISSGDGTLKLLEATSRRELRTASVGARFSEIASDDVGHLITQDSNSGSPDRFISVWTMDSLQRIAHWPRKTSFSDTFAASPDGRYIALASGADGLGHGGWLEIRTWNGETVIGPSKIEKPELSYHMAFNSGSDRLAVIGEHSWYEIWSFTSGKLQLVAAHPQVIELNEFLNQVVFSPDDKFLAMAGREAARVFEIATGRTVIGTKGLEAGFAFDAVRRHLIQLDNSGAKTLSLLWPADIIADACSRLTFNFSQSDWAALFPDEPYRQTCPGLPESKIGPFEH